MGLIDVSFTFEQLEQHHTSLSEMETRFVLWFAFSTGDRELTGKLIEEFSKSGVDKDAIRQKFEILTGFRSDWIKKLEYLLVAVEGYRIQEEKAMNRLYEFLKTTGVSMNIEEKRWTESETAQEKVMKEVRL